MVFQMVYNLDMDNNEADESTVSLYALACGPDACVKSYTGIIVNGVRYRTIDYDSRKKCQNSSIMVNGEHAGKSFVFYGVIEDILEFSYIRGKHVFLFKCKWWDLSRMSNIRVDGHITSIKVQSTWYNDDPYILASQARQVYYLPDNKNGPMWRVVQKHEHRHIYDIPLQLCTPNGLTDVETQLVDEVNSSSDEEMDEIMMIHVAENDIDELNRVGVEDDTTIVDGANEVLQLHDTICDESEEGEEDDDDIFAEYCSSSDAD